MADEQQMEQRGEDTLVAEAVGGLAHGASAELLRDHLGRLRQMTMSDRQRLDLLDRLYGHSEEVLARIWPLLWEISLPLSRKERQPLRAVQELLETLARDYLEVFDRAADPESADIGEAVPALLWRVIRSLTRHLQLSYLIAAQPEVGIWPLLHGAYANARHLGLVDFRPDGEGPSSENLYVGSLLFAASQPASFSSAELAFLLAYVHNNLPLPELGSVPPPQRSIFWIDPGRDVPAYALVRRQPPPEGGVLYFACDALAGVAARHLAALEGGLTAAELDLPPFAATVAGHGVLRRLARLWGNPLKRRFVRRRRAYRAQLCPGFAPAWRLAQGQEEGVVCSEWMIVNESPDGYAMMHMAGELGNLAVGDVVCVRQDADHSPWQIAVVRWALSDNPEHVEIGLQLFPPGAEAVLLALPERAASDTVPALLLPKVPATGSEKMLLTPAGQIPRSLQAMGAVIQGERVIVRELRAPHLEEQTARVEVFSVESEETP